MPTYQGEDPSTLARYLVTGATGLLGNNVVRQLVAAGEQVRVSTRAASDPRPLAGLAIEQSAVDLRDPAALAAAFRDVDVVIHCAGHTHIGWTQQALHQAINVEGTRAIANAARQCGARMVHVSSINAIGLGRLASPADEDSALPGIVECPYVLTKREGERIVQDEITRGLWATIVNPALMLGPWDWKPSSGKMLLSLPRIVPSAPVGAATFGDVRDAAASVIAAASRGQCGRRYILGGHTLSYKEAWRRMARSAGKLGPYLPMGPLFRGIVSPILDVYNGITGSEGDLNSAAIAMGRQEHCFSSQRAEKELGFRVRDFNQTISDAWAWFREYGYA